LLSRLAAGLYVREAAGATTQQQAITAFQQALTFYGGREGLRGFATKNAPFQCSREKPIELVRRVSPSYSGATLVCLRRAEFCVFLCDALR